MKDNFVKIYRYEDKAGLGPYNSNINKIYTDIIDAHRKYERPQMFKNINARMFSYKHGESHLSYAGCESIEKLKKWFWKTNTLIKKTKFKLVEYTINKKYVHYCEDNLQVIFIKHKAKERKIIF